MSPPPPAFRACLCARSLGHPLGARMFYLCGDFEHFSRDWLFHILPRS